MKTYNKYYKKYHLLPLYENHIFKLLNESGHIFHPDENSDYRKAISLIAKDISDVFIDEDTDIIVDNVFTDEPYDYYICNYNSNIFGNFNLLKNLRIFITVNEQQSSGICLLGSDKDLPYLKNKYKPFYKDNSHYIELATIRIVLNENIPLYDLKYEIEEILSHELIHVLDEFYRKYNKRTDKINGKIGKIENLFNIQLNDSDSFMAHKSWNNQDLARFIISCLYYT